MNSFMMFLCLTTCISIATVLAMMTSASESENALVTNYIESSTESTNYVNSSAEPTTNVESSTEPTTFVEISTEPSPTFASNEINITECNKEDNTSLKGTNSFNISGSLRSTSSYNMSGSIRSTSSYNMSGSDYLTMLPQSIIDDPIENDRCRNFGTCRFVSMLPYKYRYCHCDNECHIFGDCCSDLHVVTNKLPRQLICVPVEKKNGRVLAGILVIDKCFAEYKDLEFDLNCQQNISTAGPLVVDKNGTIYKNRHCAGCNNVTEYQLYSFQITSIKDKLLVPKYMTKINPLQQLSILLSDPDTEYKFLAPNGIEGRPCLVYQEPTVNASDDCNDYIINGVHTFEGTVYRNWFCKKGYGFFGCIGWFLFGAIRYETYPLTVMFSFAKLDGYSCEGSLQKTGGICSVSPTYTNYTRLLTFHLVLSENLDVAILQQVMMTLLFSLTVENQTKVLTAKCFNDTTDYSNINFFVYLKLKIFTTMLSNGFLIFKTRLDNFQWKAEVRTHLNETIKLHTRNKASGEGSFNIINFLENEDPLFENAGRMTEELMLKNVRTNVSAFLCYKLLVKTVLTDSSLVIQSISCFEDFKPEKKVWNTKLIWSILTYVGCSISVIALIVSIIISRRCGTPSTVPGNNMENLSLTLTLSNILFIVGIGANDFSKVCYAVGITLHYLWLASFSFMSISVTCICHKVLQTTVNFSRARIQQSSRKKICTALGGFIPLIFVIPSVMLDYFEIPNFAALYDEMACFPTGILTNAIFFASPVVLSITINLGCLITIIGYITKHRITIGQIRKSDNFQEGKVYLRICTFSGIVWIFTVVGAFYSSVYIDLVSIVLCSLQGFSVALSILTTKRTLRSFGSSGQEGVKLDACKTERKCAPGSEQDNI